MKRRSTAATLEGKWRRPLKRTPKMAADNFFGSSLVYIKLLVLWGLVLLADYFVDFRFEYLWPFWLFLRSVYDSFKYQGLAFSVFFICIAVTSDLICYLFIPIHWLFFAASTYVWVQYVWHTEKGICLPTVLLWLLFVYIEASIRLKEFKAYLDVKQLPFHLDLCRPFASHCIGYPVVTLGFGFKSYIGYRFRMRRQKEIQRLNNYYFEFLREALPPGQAREDSFNPNPSPKISLEDRLPSDSGAVICPGGSQSCSGNNNLSNGHHHHCSGGGAASVIAAAVSSSLSSCGATAAHLSSSASPLNNSSSSNSNGGFSLLSNGSPRAGTAASQSSSGGSSSNNNNNGNLDPLPSPSSSSSFHSSSSTLSSSFLSGVSLNGGSGAQSGAAAPSNSSQSNSAGSPGSSSSPLMSMPSCSSGSTLPKSSRFSNGHHHHLSNGGGSDDCGAANSSYLEQQAKSKDDLESDAASAAGTGGGGGGGGSGRKSGKSSGSSNVGKRGGKGDASKMTKEEVFSKMEADIKKQRVDLQISRNKENELRDQIISFMSSERHLKSEISNLQVEKSVLESRLSSLLATRAGEKAALSSLEKKLADERKQKAEFQMKLETERKTKKDAANAERTAQQNQNRSELMKLEAEIKTLRGELQTARDRCQSAEQEVFVLRKYKEMHGDPEVLLSTVKALTEKNNQIEKSLSSETKLKMDLFSAFGETKRDLSIKQAQLAKKDKEIMELKTKIVEVFAVMPSGGGGGLGANNSSNSSNNIVGGGITNFVPSTLSLDLPQSTDLSSSFTAGKMSSLGLADLEGKLCSNSIECAAAGIYHHSSGQQQQQGVVSAPGEGRFSPKTNGINKGGD